MTTVADAAVAVLVDSGVRRCYTVPGESFLPLLDAIGRCPSLQLVSTRHEAGAAFMADADARLTGIPAVVMATRGPGAANLSVGVQTASENSTPMIVFIGDIESAFAYRGAFQEVDLAAFYRPITKLAMRANSARQVPELVWRAIQVASSGRPGPVMISLHADLLDHELAESQSNMGQPLPVRPGLSGEDAAFVRERIVMASGPVIIAGAGAQGATAELIDFAERFDVGVYAAFRQQDVFPNHHPNYLGHLSLAPALETLDCLKRADLVLVLGDRLGEITTQAFTLPMPTTEILHIDGDAGPAGVGMRTTHSWTADCRGSLVRLLEATPSDRSYRWNAGHETLMRSVQVGPSRSERSIDPAVVIDGIAKAFPDDAIIANDAGNFSSFLHRHWLHRHPKTQVAPVGGAMGYAVPGAIGAKLAMPQRCVIGVVGDGGFLMTGYEIETAVRMDCDLTIIVMRNGLYGTIAMHQAKRGFAQTAVDIGSVDIAGLAESLGATGLSAQTEPELKHVLHKAASMRGVVVIDVQTDQDLISPTAKLSDLEAAHTACAKGATGLQGNTP